MLPFETSIAPIQAHIRLKRSMYDGDRIVELCIAMVIKELDA
jgi:hypothetical protein